MFRRALPLAVFLSAFLPVVHAQPLPDRAPIKGVVVDDDGRPVPSAVIIVRRQNDTMPTAFWGAEALADANGRFVIPEAEEGSFMVSVDAAGFASLAGFPFDWSAKSQPMRLQLLKLSPLTLRVLGTSGSPLVQAPVWVRLRDQNGQSPTRLTTNAKGEITIANVAPSTYSLMVVSKDGIATQRAVAFKSSQKEPVVARLQEGATLRIKATDANGTPVGGASLYMFAQTPDETNRLAGDNGDPGENWALVAAAGASQGLVSRDGDGTLELKHIPAGQFSVRLSIPGYGTKTRDITAQDGEVIEWKADFPARSSASLSLVVRDSNGQPVANSLVALRLLPLAENGAFEGANIMPDVIGEVPPPPVDVPGNQPILPDETNGLADMPFTGGAGARVAMTDAEGKVTLFPVRPGNYRIFASRPAVDSWLRAPVAPEGAPTDVKVSLAGPNTGGVQVP